MRERRTWATWAIPALLAFVLAQGTTAWGNPDGLSIPINFGADEPNADPDPGRSDVTGPAGVLGTENWNNLDLNVGGPQVVDADEEGAIAATSITVEWNSANTWSSAERGEENNTAPPGNDRNLMLGYLDTDNDNPSTVTVSGLDELVDGGDTYAVYVYIKGGVPDRGGDYTIGAQTFSVIDSGAFDGTYIENDNYVIFPDVSGASFTLSAQATTPADGTRRAPINAIEVVLGDVSPRIFAQRAITPATSATECPPGGLGPLTVTISRELDDADNPGEILTVIEEVSGPFGEEVIDATGLGGSTLTLIDGFVQSWLLLGPYSQDAATATPESPGDDIIRLDYLTNGVDITQDDLGDPEAGDTVNTDYAPAGLAASVALAVIDGIGPNGEAINPAGVPTWLPWDDPDETVDFIAIYGQVDNVVTHALSYIDVENEIADVDLCIGSDDAVQVLFDGVEVHINNVGRGSGAAGECQDTVDLDAAIGGPLTEGVHTILVKVFQGGGGHQLRLGFKDPATGNGLTGISYCTTPAADACATFADAGARLTFDATRQELADGVDYSVDVFDQTVNFTGTVGGEPTQGDTTVALGCLPSVVNVTCVENGSGGVDVTWDNNPLADSGVDISITVDGTVVGTVAGTESSATVDAADITGTLVSICVINSSGVPVCCAVLGEGINLADMVGGGDGTGTADPTLIGLNSDTGVFETAYLGAAVTDTGNNPQEVTASPYIDSVFVVSAADQAINTAGVIHAFDPLDVNTDANQSYGHILKDVTHDVDKDINDIWAGGVSTWATCVAIHASAGITYDLDAIRATHGELFNFSCFAGTDQCAGAALNLYVIFSDDSAVVDTPYSVLALGANSGEAITELEVPEDAAYLTLACGASDAAIGCDHGVFANAVIETEGGPIGGTQFSRGDADANGGAANITDGIYVLNFLFLGGPPPPCADAADADDNGAVNITDGIYILNFLFLGGPPPPAPAAPNCGEDTTASELTCASFPPCE